MRRLIQALFLLALHQCLSAVKYNQRLFVHAKAINFADPTKHGFRVILHEEFLKSHLGPTLLPTLFVTAVPLKADEPSFTKVFYPDSVYEDRQVAIEGLRERSWYYVCIEWENFNRHNETTGADCRLFRTLDRFGKTADSTLSDIEITEIGARALGFRLRALVDFPIRITAYLYGGSIAIPAQTFFVRESADLDVFFPYLRPDTDYGKLCVLEEPLVTSYTAMGRLIAGVNSEKCYFGSLKTKDYDIASGAPDARAYTLNNSITVSQRSSAFLLIFAALFAGIRNFRLFDSLVRLG